MGNGGEMGSAGPGKGSGSHIHPHSFIREFLKRNNKNPVYIGDVKKVIRHRLSISYYLQVRCRTNTVLSNDNTHCYQNNKG